MKLKDACSLEDERAYRVALEDLPGHSLLPALSVTVNQIRKLGGTCHHCSSLSPHFQTLSESSWLSPQTALICALPPFPICLCLDPGPTDPYSDYSKNRLQRQCVFSLQSVLSQQPEGSWEDARLMVFPPLKPKQPLTYRSSSILALVLASPEYPKARSLHTLCRNLLWFL